MLLNSYIFLLIFFPLVYAAYWYVITPQYRLVFLTLVSFIFYSAGNPADLLILFLLTLFTWGFGRLLEANHRPLLLFTAIVFVLIPLLITKYTAFTLSSISALLGQTWPLPSFFLPVGLSFYTFQSVSYLVDLYQGKVNAERRLLPVAAYLSFFPHLIAGPILRYPAVASTLKNLPSSVHEDIRFQSVIFIILGLARKVLIADSLATSVDRLLLAPENLEFWTAWAAMLGYSFQLYYDFSGYSMMALGIAGLFGIPFPQNFNRPYTAPNISEFWKRWHISLSQWLRDYIYIPLGGSRVGKGRMLFHLGVTMVIGGLWHGAAWTFVFWGVYHGIILILYHITCARNILPITPLNKVITFASVVFGWVLFRSSSLEMAGMIYRAMFGLEGIAALSTAMSGIGLSYLGLIGIAALIEWALPEDYERRLQPRWLEAGIFTMLAVWSLLSIGTAQQFLYFQF